MTRNPNLQAISHGVDSSAAQAPSIAGLRSLELKRGDAPKRHPEPALNVTSGLAELERHPIGLADLLGLGELLFGERRVVVGAREAGRQRPDAAWVVLRVLRVRVDLRL